MMSESTRGTFIAIKKYYKSATKDDLNYWLECIQKEIYLNESCNCRVAETEKELKNLYSAKHQLQKKLSLLEGG